MAGLVPGLESSPCIEYSYLADGIKLFKKVLGSDTTIRLYQNGMVFENGVLDHILTEEGKVVPFIPGNDELLDYQYFITDHLGNVRSVVREERIYEYLATMETEYSETEESQFSNIEDTRQTDPLESYTGESFAITDNNQPLGPAFALNVTKGDVVDLSVFGKTKTGGGDETVAGTEAVVAALVDAFTTQSITIGESANTLSTGLTEGLAALGMGGSSNTDATGYLNFMLFDKQFKLVTVGFRPFTSGSYTEQTIEDITIEEPGYLITYLSYESSAPDRVFFDDFSITLETSTVIQQEDYFPFGLTFNSYTSGTENLYKYNGKEEQKETGWLDYGARMYMPDLGRWGVVDPVADKYRSWSPYVYALNNPVNYIDPDGQEVQQGDNKQDGRVSEPGQDGSNVPELPPALQRTFQKVIKQEEASRPVRIAFAQAIKNSNSVHNPAQSEIDKAITNTVNSNIRADEDGNILISFAGDGKSLKEDLSKIGEKVTEETIQELVEKGFEKLPVKGVGNITKVFGILQTFLDPVSAGQSSEETQKQANTYPYGDKHLDILSTLD